MFQIFEDSSFKLFGFAFYILHKLAQNSDTVYNSKILKAHTFSACTG